MEVPEASHVAFIDDLCLSALRVAQFTAQKRTHSRGYIYIQLQVNALTCLSQFVTWIGLKLVATAKSGDVAQVKSLHDLINRFMKVTVDSMDSMIVPPPEAVLVAASGVFTSLCTVSKQVGEVTLCSPQFQQLVTGVVAPYQSMALAVQVSIQGVCMVLSLADC